jgi:RNA polymerase sigma-70 factor (ECF subfamily)
MQSSISAAGTIIRGIDVVFYFPLLDYSRLSVAELLKCCVDHNNEAAWEEFVRRFHRTIAGTICRTLRAGGPCDGALVEDLVQDTFVRLCADRSRSMREFEAAEEGCFYGYLRATAVSTVRDHFRRVRSIKRHGDAIAESLDDVANERAAAEEPEARYEDALLLQNVDEILRGGNPAETERNRLIFWLHYRDGFSAAEIARLYPVGLTVKGVDTALRRLLNEVKRGNLSARREGSGNK